MIFDSHFDIQNKTLCIFSKKKKKKSKFPLSKWRSSPNFISTEPVCHVTFIYENLSS